MRWLGIKYIEINAARIYQKRPVRIIGGKSPFEVATINIKIPRDKL